MEPLDCDIERSIRWLLLCGLTDDRFRRGDSVKTAEILIVRRMWVAGLHKRLYTCQADAATWSLYTHFSEYRRISTLRVVRLRGVDGGTIGELKGCKGLVNKLSLSDRSTPSAVFEGGGGGGENYEMRNTQVRLGGVPNETRNLDLPISSADYYP